MTRRATALVVSVLLASAASAQISLTSADVFPFPAGQPVSFVVASTGAEVSEGDRSEINGLVVRAGAGRTWDFTGIGFGAPSTSTTTRFDDPAGLPGADGFPNATLAFQEGGAGTPSLTYATLTDDAYAVLGVVFPGGAADGRDSVLTYVPDGLRRLAFPYTIGTTVSGEAALVIAPNPVLNASVRESVEVVGYGTLVLPTGSYACLMEERRTTTTGTFGGQETSFTATTYRWTTKEGAVASATNFVVPGQGRVYSARYAAPEGATGTPAEPAAAALTLVAFPNPARGSTALRLTTAAPLPVRVEVWDALGRRVALLHDGPVGAGATVFSFDARAVAPGVYVARVDAGGRTLTTRLTVAR